MPKITSGPPFPKGEIVVNDRLTQRIKFIVKPALVYPQGGQMLQQSLFSPGIWSRLSFLLQISGYIYFFLFHII